MTKQTLAILQHTISKKACAKGIALHTGKTVSVTLKPAPANYGIVLIRTDLPYNPSVKVTLENVCESQLCTSIRENGVIVHTVEHLLSALAGSGVDNLIVEIDADELPLFDGSASTWLLLIREAGIISQNALKRFIRIKEEIRISGINQESILYPYSGVKLEYDLALPRTIVKEGFQQYKIDFEHRSYNEVARARTFGFIKDVEMLKSRGLIQGGSMANAIVLGTYGLLNQNGWRMENELAAHKVLDAIGDLYVNGYQILGGFKGKHTGHSGNADLLSKLMENPSSYEIIEFSNPERMAEVIKLPSLGFIPGQPVYL